MGKQFPPETLSSAAEIIQKFIEQYHEKLEEDYLFPRFEEAGKLVDLVKVLKDQHKAGRRLTEYIKKSAVPATLKEAPKRKELATSCTCLSGCTVHMPHVRTRYSFLPCGQSCRKKNLVILARNLKKEKRICSVKGALKRLLLSRGIGKESRHL